MKILILLIGILLIGCKPKTQQSAIQETPKGVDMSGLEPGQAPDNNFYPTKNYPERRCYQLYGLSNHEASNAAKLRERCPRSLVCANDGVNRDGAVGMDCAIGQGAPEKCRGDGVNRGSSRVTEDCLRIFFPDQYPTVPQTPTQTQLPQKGSIDNQPGSDAVSFDEPVVSSGGGSGSTPAKPVFTGKGPDAPNPGQSPDGVIPTPRNNLSCYQYYGYSNHNYIDRAKLGGVCPTSLICRNDGVNRGDGTIGMDCSIGNGRVFKCSGTPLQLGRGGYIVSDACKIVFFGNN